MKTISKVFAAASALLLLGGCVSVPSGPGVMVLPGSSKSFDQFRADDMDCRQYASAQVGGPTPEQAAENSAVKSAAVGTLIGAAAGALIGGNSQGAAAGAGAGLLMGSAMGAGAATGSQYTLQQRYDNAYVQCMYAKGHRIPTSGRFENGGRRPVTSYTPPPPPNAPPPPSAGTIPPPPPGTPPPPPPGVR